jgi:citrate lyase subunit beta / citryl-CoA lyase
MLTKARSLPADEIFIDLEDSVAPGQKSEARSNAIAALNEGDWGGKTVALRVNGVGTSWTADDIATVVGKAGARLDSVIVPKVQHGHEVMFVDHLLRMIEQSRERKRAVGIEAQIESALGLANASEIARSSPRLEALVFGPADMSASLGLPAVTPGLPMPGYPGDHWHAVMMHILITARAVGLQAIDGPHLAIKDLDGLRAGSERARALGYDGKWAVHPGQIEVLNEVFTPTQGDYDKAEAVLESYGRATAEGLGVLMFGSEMIDEASARMAERVVERGRAAGLRVERSLADLEREWEGGSGA